MNCFLIDDEEVHRRGLRQLIEQFFPEIQIVGEAASLYEAQEWLRTHTADVVFLDVMLGDGTGLDLLKAMPVRPFQVVLVSAHNEFAVEAFRLSALDYLLKPIDVDDFQEAILRAKQQLQFNQTNLQLEILRENLEKLTHQNRKMVPVSYTHLDVYKRQNAGCTVFLKLPLCCCRKSVPDFPAAPPIKRSSSPS